MNAVIPKDGSSIEIKNFLGGHGSTRIDCLAGTKVKLGTEVKNELIFEGIDNANISLTCARVSQICKIGRKDERKFLDGIFVSYKGHIKDEDEWILDG